MGGTRVNGRNPVLTASLAPAQPVSSLRRFIGAIDRGVDLATQSVAALILAIEVLLLGLSVVARYVVHRPLIWSDDLAVSLFLWLSMLGATIALRWGQHLRLTTFLNATPSLLREVLEAVSVLLACVFAGALIAYGYEYAQDEAFVISPGLGLSAAYRAAALPIGGLLMLEAGLARLFSRPAPLKALAPAVLIVAAVAGALYALSGVFDAIGNWNLLIFFVGFVAVCLLIGLPIAFAFGLITIAYLGLTTTTPLVVVMGRLDGGMAHIILMAIPLFVLLGKMMEVTGMARNLVDFLLILVGRLRGGLSYTLLVAMYVISGISGAKTADMAAVAPILFPEMRKRGANEGEMVSLLAASAVMSETIPPSLLLIAIASTVGISIAALFTAGLVPALVAAIALAVLVYWRSRNEATIDEPRPPGRVILRAFLIALPGLILPFVIRAAVVEGVATATEVSTVGIAYIMVVTLLIERRFPWNQLGPILIHTAVMSGTLLLILGSANAMAWALTQSGFSDQLAQVMTHLIGGRYSFLALSVVFFIVFGSVLEGLPAIVLFGPLLFPIARTLGVHEVHFAMVAILAMGIGLYMPPFGVGYYSACAIGGVDPDVGMRRVWPYMALLLCATIVVAAVPYLSTCFLP